MAASVALRLLIGYGVSGVARIRASTFWNPSPRSQTISPFWTMAAEIAGNPGLLAQQIQVRLEGRRRERRRACAATPETRETASSAAAGQH